MQPHPKLKDADLRHGIPMASSIDKTQTITQPTSGSSGNEAARGRSIATRLTDAEFGEVEAAAAIAGKKVGEWLREAALTQARGTHHDEQTDQILLAEMMGMRSLMLNLFARASEGPLTTEDLRKMSAYSDSIKEQRAQAYMAERRRRNSPKPTDKPYETLPHSVCISLADGVDFSTPFMPAVARLLGVVSVGASATSAVLSSRLLAKLRDGESTSCPNSNPMAHGDGSGP